MKQKGFTLIELILVIVVLGILAVTAAPRFLNIQEDARTASLEGLKGSLDSALQTSYGKLSLDGLEDEPFVLSFDGIGDGATLDWCQECSFSYGYPTNMLNTWTYLIQNVGTENGEDFAFGEIKGTEQYAFTFSKDVSGGILNVSDCYVKYTPANEETKMYDLEVVPCK